MILLLNKAKLFQLSNSEITTLCEIYITVQVVTWSSYNYKGGETLFPSKDFVFSLDKINCLVADTALLHGTSL